MQFTILLLIIAVSAVQITDWTVPSKKPWNPQRCPSAQKLINYQFSKAASSFYSIFVNVYQTIIIKSKVSSFIDQVRKIDGLTVEVKTSSNKAMDLAEMLDIGNTKNKSNQENQRSINESLPPGAVILSATIQQISGFFYILVTYMYNSQYFVVLIDTGMQVGIGFRKSNPSMPLLDDFKRPIADPKAIEEACLDNVLKSISVSQITVYNSLKELNTCTENNYASNWAVLPTWIFFDIFRSGLCKLF